MGLLHEDRAEVMRPLNRNGSTSFEISESRRRKWDLFSIILSY